LPLPPLKEQNQIVAQLETIEVQTNQLLIKYQQKLRDLEELKKSILNRAFAGEL
jgi:type I restriction enzyme S subunit